MKKILLAGIILILAMGFLGTCDTELSDEDAVEYTDVLYSPDGSEVTIYLDGVKVPVSKKAQRAMTRDLAMMAYDFLEVVFVSSTVARNSWELGEPAGIAGITRGVDYAAISGTGNYACLFAGKKDGKTLFGIGKIIGVAGTEVTTTAVVTSTTEYVTFGLRAILTGLIAYNETPTAETLANNQRGVVFDSIGGTWSHGDVKLVDHGGTKYPVFGLPINTGTTNATHTFTYTFSMVGNDVTNYTAAMRYPTSTATSPRAVVQRRTPRYRAGGQYMEARVMVDTKTKIGFGSNYDIVASAAAFAPGVPLVLTVPPNASGFFTFYLEIPVYNNTIADATNLSANNIPATRWYIRTGYGSELYSLDDGASNGGCMILGSGGSSVSDWLGIEWQWIPYPTS